MQLECRSVGSHDVARRLTQRIGSFGSGIRSMVETDELRNFFVPR